METIKEINLNVSQPNNFQLIHVMQGSVNSIKVIAHLYDGNKPYVIPDSVSEYQLLGVLPSGKYLIDDRLSQYDDHSVSFLINHNMMAKAGYVRFSISLVDADDTAIMETFPANIMVTAIPGQDYEQTDEIPIVTKALQEVQCNRKRAEEAAEKSEGAYQNLISEKGQPNGIASLDENGKLSSQSVAFDDGINLADKMQLKADSNDTVLTGVPKAPTASAGTNTEQIATTAFVQASVSEGIAASDALMFKGTIGTNGVVTELPDTYKTGWTYRVVSEGTYAGNVCEVGDLIVALVDRNGSDNADSDWCVAQTNIDGAITEIKSGDDYIDYSQSGSVITITHKDVERTDTTSTLKPTAGSAFTTIKSVNSDSKGHITNVETETVTLPSLDATGLGIVSTKASQELSDTEKQNARDNIDAVNKNGDTITGNIVGSDGGQFAIDGNVYLNSQGYHGWLTNHLDKYSKSKGSFTGNVDNLYTTNDNGTYWITVANASGTHPPNNGHYDLIVGSITDNSAAQIAVVWNGDGVAATMYVRLRANSIWSPWKKSADGGNAATAAKLSTARTIQTNLSANTSSNFDGSANITPGVTGTLSVANGGTGKATLTAGQVLVGNGTGAVSQRAIDTTRGGTASSTSLITSGAVNGAVAKIAAYGSKKSESLTLDQNCKYIVISKGYATSTATESIGIYYYSSGWKNITLIGTGFPGISVSGNTMSITYSDSTSSYRQTAYAVIKML